MPGRSGASRAAGYLPPQAHATSQVPDDPTPPDARTTADALDAAAEARVLVVGDAMLDRYVSGRVDRISPEAPVPVVRVEEEREAPGGAANVAVGVAALGAGCRLVSAVGADRDAARLARLLDGAGVGPDALVEAPDRPTTVKSRVLARHQQMLRVDRESAAPLAEEVRERVLERALAELDGADVVAVVDYDKGVLDGGVGRRVVEAARNRGVPSVVDPKLRSFFEYGKAHVFKPNGLELASALGEEAPPRGEEELREVRGRLGCRHLLLTLGEEGMVLVGEDESGPLEIASEAREVFDVSGAGDTVTAVLASAMAGGLEVGRAAMVANVAAGLEVSHLGAVPVARAELLEALDGNRSRLPSEPGDAGTPGARRTRADHDAEEQ